MRITRQTNVVASLRAHKQHIVRNIGLPKITRERRRRFTEINCVWPIHFSGKSHRERERPPPPPRRSYRLPSRNARDYPQVVCFSQCASVTDWVVQKFARKLCRAPVLRAGRAFWAGQGRRCMRSNKRARTHTVVDIYLHIRGRMWR